MSLYKKYRPQSLAEMKGNQALISAIKAHFQQAEPQPRDPALRGKRLRQDYTGPRGQQGVPRRGRH
jgi:hypothetical protein